MKVDINILIEQMVMFFVIMCCGYAGAKIHLLTKEMLQGLSKLMINIVCPMMVMCIYPAALGEGGVGKIALQVMPLCALFYVGLAVFAFMLATVLGFRGDKRRIFMAKCQFGNLGFFGLPLVKEIFDVKGIVAFSFCIIVDSIFIWTEGVVLTSHCGEGHVRFSIRDFLVKMVNPVSIAVVAGLLLMAFRVSPDSLVLQACDSIGSCAKPLALIYIGGSIAGMDKGFLRGIWPVSFVVLLKMLLMPVIAFYVLTACSVSPVIVKALTLVLSLPSMASLPIMAANFGNTEEDYATQSVFVITLCSLITIPLVVMLTNF